MHLSMTRGPRSPLSPEKQELAARYLPMARTLARPSKLDWPAIRDEFESAACLALVEAAEAFDPACRVEFSTFARHRIVGALLDAKRERVLRGFRNAPEEAPAVMSLFGYHEQNGGIVNAIAAPPPAQELDAAEEFERWMRKLPRRHASACRLIYARHKTHEQAAEALGCSPSHVSRLHREALGMFRGTWRTVPRDRKKVAG